MDIDPLPTPSPGVNFISSLLCSLQHASGDAITFHAPDNWGSWILIVAIAMVCLCLSAFVSGSEIAYFGLNTSQLDQLRESDRQDAKKAFNLISRSEQLLATILIANNLVNITMVVLLTFAINSTVSFHSGILNFLVQTVFLTFLLLLFGEIFPKLVARGRMTKWVLTSAPGINALFLLLSPVSKIMVHSTSFLNRVVTKKQEHISTDELEKALEISDLKEGQEKEMLEGILSFGEKEVSEIMIPRIDVTGIEYHDTWGEAMQVILDSGFSRIPVYDTSQDSIRGILYAKDVLPYIGSHNTTFRWQSIIRPAYFVPESRMIDDLLEDFRKKKIHIAIVVDEYGGTRGIVTLEDIIEEILGEIDDEYDHEEKMYRLVAPDTWIFDAKISLGDFCHATDIEEEQLGDVGDAETLAGLLLEIKGDFPTVKETLHKGCFDFTVLKMERHRILRIKVKKISKPSDVK